MHAHVPPSVAGARKMLDMYAATALINRRIRCTGDRKNLRAEDAASFEQLLLFLPEDAAEIREVAIHELFIYLYTYLQSRDPTEIPKDLI